MAYVQSRKFAGSGSAGDSGDVFRGRSDGEVRTKPLEVVRQTLGGNANWSTMGTICVDWRGEAAVMNPQQVRHALQQPQINRLLFEHQWPALSYSLPFFSCIPGRL